MLPKRNVLVLHSGALGDFILAWPLLLALGRLHPQSRIIAVTHASKGVLAEAALRIESADIEHGWHALFGDGVKLDDRAAKLKCQSAVEIVSITRGSGQTGASQGKCWFSRPSNGCSV